MMTAAQTIPQVETLIVGMGVTGLSCARFLSKHNIAFRLIDDRSAPPMLNIFQTEFAGADMQLGRFDDASLTGIQRLILSPGISSQHPFVQLATQKNIEVIGDIELFAQYANAPVIGITGSNGKSTVTTLIAEMLRDMDKKVEVGGNLGTAALDLLSETAPDFYVLELSSFQLDTTNHLNLAVAALLNITADHMDRYADINAYAASKARILKHARHAVLNKDDLQVAMLPVNRELMTTAFTACQPGENEFGLLEEQDNIYLAFGKQKLLAVNELQLQGRHNWVNALAALAVIHAADLSIEKALPALKAFQGLPHRCQLIAKYEGVSWINDSKATNIGAANAAINSMQSPIVLIAGGDGKGADFSELSEAVRAKVKLIILLGKDADRMQAVLKSITPCKCVVDMRAAVQEASLAANNGDVVLLAPACASLDMYKNYMARGDDFRDCVLSLLDSDGSGTGSGSGAGIRGMH